MTTKENKKIWVNFPYTNWMSWFNGLQHKHEHCKLLKWESGAGHSTKALVERPSGEVISVHCHFTSLILLK